MPYLDWFKASDGIEEFRIVGATVTVRIFFVNTSDAPTTIKHFSLSVEHMEANQTYHALPPSEEPILRTSWDDSKSDSEQDYVDNLVEFSKQRKEATRGIGVEGYLQFKVPGFLMPQSGVTTWKPVVVITDAWRQPHELFFQRGTPLLPSQLISGAVKPVVMKV